jgi:Flp pilus assembly protein TadD
MTVPLPLILFPILALILYGPALNGEAIYDDPSVLDDAKQPQWRVWHYPRPLTILLYRLTHVWPGTLRGHHVTNVLVHAVNCYLIYNVAETIGVNPWIAGLLMLAHPFAVNAVAYISGLASVLSTTFGLLGCLLILQHHPLLSLLSVSMSVMAKQDGISFFPTLILLSLTNSQTRFAEIAGFIGLATAVPAILYYRKHFSPEREARSHILEGFPPPMEQPDHAFTVLVHTLRLLPLWAFGFGSAVKHGGGIETSALHVAESYIGMALLIFLGWFYPIPVTLLLCGPWLVYCVFRIHEPLAEYRNYAQVAGFALLIGTLPLLLSVVAIGWFGYRTRSFSATYRTAIGFWTEATRTGLGDRSLAWHNLGGHYMSAGKLQEAEEAAAQAVKLNPRCAPAMKNRAWCLVQLGREKEALPLMNLACNAYPTNPLYWHEFAIMLQERGGSLSLADYAITKALEIKPDSSMWNRAGIIRYLKGQLESAEFCFGKAIAQDENPVFRFNLALTEKAMGFDNKADSILATLPRQLKITGDMIPPMTQEVAR